jgi:hypothetical protein
MLRRAISRATLIRLRSILLTSGTTIVGLIPLLLRIEQVPWQIPWLFNVTLPFRLTWMDSENQDIWENLALASIGGLISSTVLILLTIPALYYFTVRSGWILRRFWNWRRRAVRKVFHGESIDESRDEDRGDDRGEAGSTTGTPQPEPVPSS